MELVPSTDRTDVRLQGNRGLTTLAETAWLDQEHLFRILSENGNPELRSLGALLSALVSRLSVELKAPG